MNLVELAPQLFVPDDFEKNHHYFADAEGKKEYTGITTVLGVIAKPALIQWAANMAVDYIEEHLNDYEKPDTAKMVAEGKSWWDLVGFFTAHLEKILKEARYAHRKKKETAATAGTDIHAEIEAYVRDSIGRNGGKPLGALHSGIKPFVDWAISENVRFLEAEKRLFSREHWIAGTADLVFEKDGKTYIGDIKTYKKLWDRIPMLQCAGYGLMWGEMQADTGGYEHKPIDGYCIIRIKDDFEVKWSYDVAGDRKGFLAALELYKTLQNWN